MANEKEAEKKELPTPSESMVQTHHTVEINGQTIAYTATAGTIMLKEEVDEKGEQAKALVFYVAYTKDNVDNITTRPVTFSFNGGPGSSSVWMHLGLLGPRRVVMDDIGNPLPPPYALVNNEFSLLDESDLVFIDPVSTGYSRAVPGEKAQQFHDFKKDIESMGDFIRLYCSRQKRWASPKFLIGESYGTTRASGLSGYLQERYGMYLNGIMLISAILNFQTASFVPGNDLPHILFLPTYTATAWYHNLLAPELQADLTATLAEVKEWAMTEYTVAMMAGDSLPEAEQAKIAAKLARYTGLSEKYIRQTNLRIDIHQFVKELLRDDRRTVGRLDSRFKGIDRNATGDGHEYDPSYATILGTYTGTIYQYLCDDLNYPTDLPYEILNFKVFPAWAYDQHKNNFVDVAETLRSAITTNPDLKVIVANGYFDLATPYLATEYTFNHMQLDPSLRPNITFKYYEAGHMMYVHKGELGQLKADLAAFVQSAYPHN